MPSSKSFFNMAIVRKDITRFAPVWGLYSVVLVLILQMLQPNTDTERYRFALNLAKAMPQMPILALFYGPICALALFGDLYDQRRCYALHAMPLRREGWFFSHLASGFLFSFVPNLVFAAISAAQGANAWLPAALWLLEMTLCFLFFFGMAVLCALCAGNWLGLAALYGTGNCLGLLAYMMFERIYYPLLPGVAPNLDFLMPFIPIMWLCSGSYLSMGTTGISGTAIYLPHGEIAILGDGWGYLAGCALVGAAFLGLALWTYRKRHLEFAGDFLALRALRPVMLVILTLGAGMFFYVLYQLFEGRGAALWPLALGTAVGFFVTKMFLARSVRVFGWKSWAQFACIGLALTASILVVQSDPMGAVERVPAVSQVENVRFDFWGDDALFTDPEAIEAVHRLHQLGIQEQESQAEAGYQGDFQVELTYRLKDGAILRREYNFPVDAQNPGSLQEAHTIIQKLCSRPSIVFSDVMRRYNLTEEEAAAFLVEQGTNVYLLDRNVSPEQLSGLMEALLQDAAEGHLAQWFPLHDVRGCGQYDSITWYFSPDRADVQPGRAPASGEDCVIIDIYSCTAHTRQWIQENT